MTDLVWLVPALPLAGALILIVFGARIGEPRAGWLATLATASSFVVTVLVYFDLLGMPSEERSHVVRLFSWIPVGSLQIDLAFLADPLSVTMALFVTGIGSLIHLYAIGYMHGDPKFSKFFLYLNLFVFSMLALVLGENLLVTFLGWEGVGACSYFLISFWHTRESAAVAGKKAFVTNRIGDWGVMTAMFVAFPRSARCRTRRSTRRHTKARCRRRRFRQSQSCSSSGPAERARNCRCTSGCPTRWRARLRSRRSSTPQRW